MRAKEVLLRKPLEVAGDLNVFCRDEILFYCVNITPQALSGEDRRCLSDRARLPPPYVFQ